MGFEAKFSLLSLNSKTLKYEDIKDVMPKTNDNIIVEKSYFATYCPELILEICNWFSKNIFRDNSVSKTNLITILDNAESLYNKELETIKDFPNEEKINILKNFGEELNSIEKEFIKFFKDDENSKYKNKLHSLRTSNVKEIIKIQIAANKPIEEIIEYAKNQFNNYPAYCIDCLNFACGHCLELTTQSDDDDTKIHYAIDYLINLRYTILILYRLEINEASDLMTGHLTTSAINNTQTKIKDEFKNEVEKIINTYQSLIDIYVSQVDLHKNNSSEFQIFEKQRNETEDQLLNPASLIQDLEPKFTNPAECEKYALLYQELAKLHDAIAGHTEDKDYAKHHSIKAASYYLAAGVCYKYSAESLGYFDFQRNKENINAKLCFDSAIRLNVDNKDYLNNCKKLKQSVSDDIFNYYISLAKLAPLDKKQEYLSLALSNVSYKDQIDKHKKYDQIIDVYELQISSPQNTRAFQSFEKQRNEIEKQLLDSHSFIQVPILRFTNPTKYKKYALLYENLAKYHAAFEELSDTDENLKKIHLIKAALYYLAAGICYKHSADSLSNFDRLKELDYKSAESCFDSAIRLNVDSYSYIICKKLKKSINEDLFKHHIVCAEHASLSEKEKHLSSALDIAGYTDQINKKHVLNFLRIATIAAGTDQISKTHILNSLREYYMGLDDESEFISKFKKFVKGDIAIQDQEQVFLQLEDEYISNKIIPILNQNIEDPQLEEKDFINLIIFYLSLNKQMLWLNLTNLAFCEYLKNFLDNNSQVQDVKNYTLSCFIKAILQINNYKTYIYNQTLNTSKYFTEDQEVLYNIGDRIIRDRENGNFDHPGRITNYYIKFGNTTFPLHNLFTIQKAKSNGTDKFIIEYNEDIIQKLNISNIQKTIIPILAYQHFLNAYCGTFIHTLHMFGIYNQSSPKPDIEYTFQPHNNNNDTTVLTVITYGSVKITCKYIFDNERINKIKNSGYVEFDNGVSKSELIKIEYKEGIWD